MTTNMNIIDITNDVTEIKEDNIITENTNMTTIEKETTVDEAFAEAFYKVKALVDAQAAQGIAHPTFFEFIYLMAMWAFGKAGIEYGVIETGLGGRLDLTNAVERPDLTVITSIGLDHTAILGDTIEKIAAEKAGIIKPGVPLVYLAARPEAAQVIEKRAGEILSWPVRPEWMVDISGTAGQIHFSLECPYFEKYDIMLNTNGMYQVENAALAVTAMEILKKDLERCEPETEFRRRLLTGLEMMRWPGRMESVGEDVYVDGAHNDDGIRELVRSVEQAFPEKDIYLVFLILHGFHEYLWYETIGHYHLQILKLNNHFEHYFFQQIHHNYQA